MTDNPLLRIGPFSRASSLSIKALRAYHEAGLLVPAEVDPSNGYRSYSVAQLTDAAIIRRLRDLDVPLDAIATVLAARDPEVTSKVLAEQGTVLQTRLADTQRAIEDLQVALARPSLNTPVHRRHEPVCTVLSVSATVTEDEWVAFLVSSHELLVAAADASGAVVDGPFGACYPTLLDDSGQDVTAFLPVASPSLLPQSARTAGVIVDQLAATDVAVLAHSGSYDELVDAYRALGAWVAVHAAPAELPVREVYVVSPVDTDDETAYRTEICWPVEPAT